MIWKKERKATKRRIWMEECERKEVEKGTQGEKKELSRGEGGGGGMRGVRQRKS
jgi:hypothetical protein